ncbi:hypothetical protein D3C86_1343940 [compost metagenome]
MKTFRPTELMNQIVGSGIWPNVGRIARIHPNSNPAMSVPPAVEIVSGMLPSLSTAAPTSAPIRMASDMEATSVTLVGRSI